MKPLVQKTRPLKMPEKVEELAYLAGIFDGEGTVTTRIVKGREYGGVAIANCDRELISWLGSLGGGITITSHPRTDTRTCYSWYVSSAVDTIAFLEALLPYLRIKRKTGSAKLRDLRQRLADREAVLAERNEKILSLWDRGYGSYRSIALVVKCDRRTVRTVIENAA